MLIQRNSRCWSYRPGSPIIRGYDTSALFRDDCLERIKYLQAEVDASMKEIQLKKEHAATEERLRGLKKEFGWIDSPKPRDDGPGYE